MRKTIRERILGTLSKQQARGQKPVINRSVAEKSFKDYNDPWSTNDGIHNSIMRIARDMANDGILKRTERGNYTLTAKGKRLI